MTIAQLKAWRKKLGLSQPEAAKLLEVSLATLRRWEQDRNKLHPLLGPACAYHAMMQSETRRANEKGA